MKTGLKLAAAAAALLAVGFTASIANAQLGPCKGGYRMLGNGVLVTCHDNDGMSGAPLYTGSIGSPRPIYVEPRVHVGEYGGGYPRYGNYYDNPYAYSNAYQGRPYASYDGYDRHYDRRHRYHSSWRDCGPAGATFGIAPLFGASVC